MTSPNNDKNYPVIATRRFYEVAKILACGISRLYREEDEELMVNPLDSADSQSVHGEDSNPKTRS